MPIAIATHTYCMIVKGRLYKEKELSPDPASREEVVKRLKAQIKKERRTKRLWTFFGK